VVEEEEVELVVGSHSQLTWNHMAAELRACFPHFSVQQRTAISVEGAASRMVACLESVQTTKSLEETYGTTSSCFSGIDICES
jgi:hypothetical protein